MSVPDVIITDVGPRDGLQNQSRILTPDQRIALIEQLIQAGVRQIEAGAMVSPKAVPAMAGSDEVIASLAKRHRTDPQARGQSKARVQLQALIPNLKGYQLAVKAGADSVLFVVCASETMNQKNVRLSVQQSVQQLQQILQQAKADNIQLLTCIAVAWQCPFEGKTPPSQVLSLASSLAEIGAEQLVLADTIGAANPASVRQLMQALVQAHDASKLGCHFHDTRAMGLANVAAALDVGIRRFDASIGGLGGCPFAPGATGNVATEDVVMMLEQMGLATGIDLAALCQAGQLAGELTGQCSGGRANSWRQLQLAAKQPLC
ncbi:hydroxymethylglutaryl-CoA lyase [Alkalimonas sp. MEB108]|uniref:Hydroxymethylglutaryl-CoA lyase n=1 Tax=Alkalimonas cellulosilytica TaxID=3058395 RepID=A0ABU7JAC9_9GAMM|nr:hydroxymethylglutaryl-CoA lyase [Alkalimonas sp. MEB108]MEE2002947.1 hydroxymethylglutaryl-CoA lyase [Alkalimonas sp. MEB108]